MDIPELVHGHYLKVPVCKTQDFQILFEEHVFGTFAHCNVYNYSPSVKRHLSICWNQVANLHGGPIYALHDQTDHKHEKFLCLFGFTRFKSLPNLEEIWIWTKRD